MSAPDPVDLESAGLLLSQARLGTAPSGEQSIPDGAAVTGLASILRALLPGRSGIGGAGAGRADGVDRAEEAARLIWPAVVSLNRLRGCVSAGSCNGLVHRRCRIDPAEPGRAAPESPPGVLRWKPVGRASAWEAAVARVGMGQTTVTHWLARVRPGAQTTAPLADDPPGEPRPAPLTPVGPGPARLDGRGAGLDLRAADVTAWARSSGDANAIHTVAGAARAAGLVAGADQIVAHGLLLAGLSLASAPARRGAGVDLRFPSPLCVPQGGGVRIAIDPHGGIRGPQGQVLRRRDHL